MSASNYKQRVAFQGERGAFSEEAAMKLLGVNLELVPCSTFAGLFRSLSEGIADYILAPVENTISGMVHPSINLLNQSDLAIVDEVWIPIAQHLIACPYANFDKLKTVQSHPVALAQCTRFLTTNPQLTPLEAADTAGSVAEIIKSGDLKRAAIASKRAAEIYGGTILRENIQDRAENYTRFVLLAIPSERDPEDNHSMKRNES